MAIRERPVPAEGSPPPGTPDVTPVPPPAPPPASSYPWDRVLRWVDRRQQRITPLAVLGGVLKKSGEDQLGLLAAVMSNNGMLSLLPLLLLVISITGFIFRDDARAQQALLDAALTNFPGLGDQLRANIQALPGSGVAIVVGAVFLAWGALGFTRTAQVAMGEIWNVPRRLRPGFWPQLGRSIWALGMLALPTACTAVLTILGTSGFTLTVEVKTQSPLGVILAVVVAFLSLGVLLSLNFASHLLAFRALTPRVVATRHLWAGTVIFTIYWTALTAFGSALVANRLARANQLYGTIGFIIGLLFWIYLGAYGALMSAELNSVRANRLYPRTLFGLPATAADRRALRARARTEEMVPGEVVEVRFEEALPSGGDLPTDPY